MAGENQQVILSNSIPNNFLVKQNIRKRITDVLKIPKKE